MDMTKIEKFIESQFNSTKVWVGEFKKHEDISSHIEACFSLGRLFGAISMMKLFDESKYDGYMVRYDEFEAPKFRDWRKSNG